MKGTPAKGLKRNKGRLHLRCRRCGRAAYHKIKKFCSSCGYGRSKRMRRHNWCKKDITKVRISAKIRRHTDKRKTSGYKLA